ncbi:hypothetical protein WSS_A29189 [Rhodococcus opacus M213]|uniref:Uncharacterized protein n=1 Tax=Rhodococcus opacus M213 TaxID=1129896 RepID=K8XDY9_RHOOP|nr:hypothetical protein WSS_A29189 [Rhodococcus opacus M213]
MDDITIARASRFISKIVVEELGSRLENPFQDFTLEDMGTSEEWDEILALGLGPTLTEMIAETCVSGLDEKYPALAEIRGQMTSVSTLPAEYLSLDFELEPEYRTVASEMFDAALQGTDTETVKAKIAVLDGDGQANVILTAIALFTVLAKVFHQLTTGKMADDEPTLSLGSDG